MTRDGIRSRGRRRFPRIELDTLWQVTDVTAGTVMDLQDVSLGGFRALSPLPVNPGTRHRFLVDSPEMIRLPMIAEAVYCGPAPGGLSPYAIGWRWGTDSATARACARLVDLVTDARLVAKRARLDATSGHVAPVH